MVFFKQEFGTEWEVSEIEKWGRVVTTGILLWPFDGFAFLFLGDAHFHKQDFKQIKEQYFGFVKWNMEVKVWFMYGDSWFQVYHCSWLFELLQLI